MEKKRDDEELCRSVFDEYLLNLFESEEITWTPVKQRDEPPDFYLKLAGENYAVEVTSLIETIRVGRGKHVPDLSILMSLKRLVDRVGNQAQTDGYLQGGYWVGFKEPFENFKIIGSELEKGLVDYIRNTKSEVSAPEAIIFSKFNQICTITKGHNKANEVRMSWMRGGINIDGMESEICRLVKGAIEKKERQLRRIPLPKIILLYDLYGFGEYNLANPLIRTHCVEALVDQLYSFKAIFVIRDDNKGFTFHPEEMEWKRALFSKGPPNSAVP
ncbi:MAG: hypothetical protein L0Z70_15450 [Chloroflexi bacterium]|nr:hypothetical protein [Chloroflexota bacterium]